MRKRLALPCVALVALLAYVAGQQTMPTHAQDAKDPRTPSPEQMQKMMQEWMKLMQPGEHHKKLDLHVGEWETTTKMFMGGPDAPATTSKGKSSIKWVLGKRFLQEQVKSTFKMPDGKGGMASMPYEAIGYFGYDNARNVYTSVWMDSMGTQIINSVGSVDASGKNFRYFGEMDEPTLGVFGRTFKVASNYKDDDNFVVTFYDLHVADDYKVMEIAYKRSK